MQCTRPSLRLVLLAACLGFASAAWAFPTNCPPDTSADTVSDPVARSLNFDSRQLQDKSPFGATPAGTTVQFGISALPGISAVRLVVEKRDLEGDQDTLTYTELARLPLQSHPDGAQVRWQASYTFADASVYGYWFEVSIGAQTFVYQNNAQPVFWTRECGTGGVGLLTPVPPDTRLIRRFRHTAYAADFKVPDWAADVVYYYIFPDRFRNGDRRNDPRPGRDRSHNFGVEFHKNWLDAPWRPGSGDGSDAYYNNDFFGGDLAGIIQKLDYIHGLGANTIYMTPIFRASSNHKYDTADYKNVDPAFGSNADFVRLTREAAKRGMRVIPDTSLNHTGADSLYFDQFSNFHSHGAFEGAQVRPDSPYADWYQFDTSQTEVDKQFKGWVGVSDLPEINKASPSFRAFAYGDPDSVMKIWLDRGAAGWRMDVAPWVPDDFWREWRSAVKQHKPDALTVAETWFDASKFFLGDTFDANMNYIFRSTVLAYAAGGDARALYPNIEHLREAYPPQSFFAAMNLLSTHDTARSLHVLGWQSNNSDAATIQLAKQRFKLAVFFQMMFPGAPTVFYGDEVGVTGGDDPYNRVTYPWADRGGHPDTDMLATFKRLIRLRNEHPVLRRGSIAAPVYLDAHTIVLLRTLNQQLAISATNNSDTAQSLNLALPAGMNGQVFTNALSGARASVVQDHLLLEIPARFGAVYFNQTRTP